MLILLNPIRPKPFKLFILILSSMKSLKSIAFVSCASFLLFSCQKESTLEKNLSLDLASASNQNINQGGANFIPDEYIVVFKDDINDVENKAKGIANQFGAAPKFIYKNALKGFSVKLPATALEKLKLNPNIKYIEQDQISSINDAVTGIQSNPTWGLDRVDNLNSINGSYTYKYNGSSVDAYIFDTGIFFTHNEFGGRAQNGYDATGSRVPGLDKNGHGTHVAGTVGGNIYGIAKAVKLFAVKVLNDQGSGSNSGIVAGIDWAIGHHKTSNRPAVGNMSLGGSASSVIDAAVQNAINNGIVMCVAAGNESTDASTKSPARVADAITVGATTNIDAKASYSNYGSVIDIHAPGTSITSSWCTSTTAIKTIDGTSMASPHVAGAAVLYLDQYVDATVKSVRDALSLSATPGEISGLISGTKNLLLYTFFLDPNTPVVPNVPVGISPSSLAIDVPLNAKLIWTESLGATSYDLQFSTSSDLSGSPIFGGSVSTSYSSPTNLLRNTTYYWRVRANNLNGPSDWSQTYSFTTSLYEPTAPTLLLPSNGATGLSSTVTFKWEPVIGAQKYQIVVSTNPDPLINFITSPSTTSTSIPIGGFKRATTYYWTVRIATSPIDWGPWQKVPFKFTTK